MVWLTDLFKLFKLEKGMNRKGSAAAVIPNLEKLKVQLKRPPFLHDPKKDLETVFNHLVVILPVADADAIASNFGFKKGEWKLGTVKSQKFDKVFNREIKLLLTERSSTSAPRRQRSRPSVSQSRCPAPERGPGQVTPGRRRRPSPGAARAGGQAVGGPPGGRREELAPGRPGRRRDREASDRGRQGNPQRHAGAESQGRLDVRFHPVVHEEGRCGGEVPDRDARRAGHVGPERTAGHPRSRPTPPRGTARATPIRPACSSN